MIDGVQPSKNTAFTKKKYLSMIVQSLVKYNLFHTVISHTGNLYQPVYYMRAPR